jgi:microcystin-dependent protein
MWSGDPGAIPVGWAPCDGVGGRPNLLGRFVVGYSQVDEDYNAIGKNGGSKTVTLTVNQMPAHTHTVNTMDKAGLSDNANDRDVMIPSSTLRTTSSTGGGKEHENRPPYYVLAYIIKL